MSGARFTAILAAYAGPLASFSRRFATLVRCAGLLVDLIVERALVDGVLQVAHAAWAARATTTRARGAWPWVAVAAATATVAAFLASAATR